MGDNPVVTQQNGGGGGGDFVIELSDLNKSVADSIKVKLEKLFPSPFGKLCCIYKVHDKFRKLKEYAYTPEMVSIGPFHRGKISLLAMEDHKLRYMHMLLSRTPAPDTKLAECIKSISELEEKARKCYSEPIDLDSKEFVEMMVVDGLFIMELFGKSAGLVKIDKEDSLFCNIWGMPSLVRDMILLENQIPMLVLECIFDLVKESLDGRSLSELALRFFNPLMERKPEVLQKYFKWTGKKVGKHLLDLLSKTFRDSLQGEKKKNQMLKHIPCVTELRNAGVKFKKGSATGSFVDIRFQDGVMTIPPLLIQDQTDTLLRNLIASEQSCNGRSTYMTSYAFLMDSLINSANDVHLLRKYGIITNYLGDDEDAASLFNKLCCEVTLVNFYYSELCDRVNEHCSARWRVWEATLKRDYFHNPWVIFSLLAAVLLILLTLTGTTVSVLSYVNDVRSPSPSRNNP